MLKSLFATISAAFGGTASVEAQDDEELWQSNYDARQDYFERAVGEFPPDILKMLNMTGVWPGGGLYVIPSPKLGANLSVYTTFGLSNVDMPAGTRMTNYSVSADGAQGTLEKKAVTPGRPGYAGYGYEIVVISREAQEWPVNLLQWAVNAEIGSDAGLLDRVEKYGGLTVEQISVGPEGPVNVLISKARPPLPTGLQLPGGKMEILVATTVTDEEMHWSMEHGRAALLEKLMTLGVGQVSVLGRTGVVA